MKRIIFLLSCMLSCMLTYGQYTHVEQLPQKLRDSILVEVATKAISKYSEGYLRPGAVPFIQDLGPLKETFPAVGPEYLGVYFFTVYYRGTEEEHKYFNRDYLVKVFIRADNCRPVFIKYILESENWIWGLDTDKMMNIEWKHKKRFESIEEIETEKRNMIRTVISNIPNDSLDRFDARARQMRDSMLKENRRKNELRRQALKAKQDSINSQTDLK